MQKACEIYVPTYDDMFGAKFKKGQSCGFAPIDKCGFLRPGEVTVVVSRAQWLRSALAMNLAAEKALSEGKAGGVLVVSPRLSAEEYLGAMARMMAEVDTWRLSRGLVAKAERAAESNRYAAAVARLKGARLCVEDEYCIDPDEIFAAAWRANGDGGFGLVVIDQLQDVCCGPLGNASVGWGVIGSRLHRIATLHGVPVLVLSGAATKGITSANALYGYGCLHEYVDQTVELARVARHAEDGTLSFVMRRVGGPDYESDVRIKMSLKSFKIIDCKESRKGSREAVASRRL